MAPRPKTFTAVCQFNVAGDFFEPGDVVEGRALARVLPFGDLFVTSTTPKEIE